MSTPTIIPGCYPTGPLPKGTIVKCYMPTIAQDPDGGLVCTGLSASFVTGTIEASNSYEHTVIMDASRATMMVPDDGRVKAKVESLCHYCGRPTADPEDSEHVHDLSGDAICEDCAEQEGYTD